MTTLTQEFIEQGLRLAPDERERFANLLLDSLDEADADDETVHRESQEEIQRRWDRYKSGEDPTYTVEEVMASLRKQAEDRKP